MITNRTNTLLVNLAKIERGVSKIYEHLSKRKGFTRPVQKFWKTLMEEELTHAKIFDAIREKGGVEDSFQFEIDADLGELKEFVQRANKLLVKIVAEDVSESEAYSFGAIIEAEFDEAAFIKKIKTNDEGIAKMIKRIDEETKKHRMVLMNYSRGVR